MTSEDLLLAVLYHASQFREDKILNYEEIANLYHMNFGSSALKTLALNLDLDGRFDTINPFAGYVTPRGTRYIEENIGENLAAVLEQHGLHVDELEQQGEHTEDDGGEIGIGSDRAARVISESQQWTGRILPEEHRESLIANIDYALGALDALQITNEKKAQGRCFLLAARDLAEAPDPPFDLIQLLLRHFDRSIGIAGLLMGVASLMLAL